MLNILLEGYDISADWIYDKLKNYIKPHHSVVVVAFSFRDERVKTLEDWNLLYSKENGKYYGGITGGFARYGISDDKIQFLNYFTDSKESAADKISASDIIYFTGGLPDRMMERIKEFELEAVLKNYSGIVMGYSAGAVIQLAEYHLSPDADYKEFAYYEGLGYIDNFYLEVHYGNTDVQNESVKKVLSERKKTVYALNLGKGAIVVDNGKIDLLGDVRIFN